jgi:hypothetical protein
MITPSRGRKEFSLYWYDPNGNQHEEIRFDYIDNVMGRVKTLIRNPINKALGTVRKIIVTDGGDCCCFHWEHDKGVVFPTEANIQAANTAPSS